MIFLVRPNTRSIPFPEKSTGPVVFLIEDNWNDWEDWFTMYSVVIFIDSKMTRLGAVKIGQKHMKNGRPPLPSKFDVLNEEFFSLGQDENYYETLNALGNDIKKSYLEAINDCAFSSKILEKNKKELVFSKSLTRYVSIERIKNRFHRLAHGQVTLSSYKFAFNLPNHFDSYEESLTLDFSVTPSTTPSTNIHVLIGRNGVGKTFYLECLAKAFLLGNGIDSKEFGKIINVANFNSETKDHDTELAGLIKISFSVFDKYGPFIELDKINKKYNYIGLMKHQVNNNKNTGVKKYKLVIKNSRELNKEFCKSILGCSKGVKRDRWERAVKNLKSDPVFRELGILSLLDSESDKIILQKSSDLFSKLSSGHSAILLAITKLVEFIEEKTLVLIDEPESHLHPPLLSAFLRCLSELLLDRNGIAILATHSPVVLQEVPASCVWKINRIENETLIERPTIETYGENVGVLTREVFKLEVTKTGFYKLIYEHSKTKTYEEIIEIFGDQIGAEGRALARSLTLLSQQ